jgi:hypothetical protein
MTDWLRKKPKQWPSVVDLLRAFALLFAYICANLLEFLSILVFQYALDEEGNLL